MISFRLNALIVIVQELEYAQRIRRYHENRWSRIFGDRYLRRHLLKVRDTQVPAFLNLVKMLGDLGLSSSEDQALRVLMLVSDPSKTSMQEYAETLQALLDRLVDDTRRHEFFMIPAHKLATYNDARQMFGEKVNAAFPSAQKEIEQAAKCYSFGRNTATVFHLMRVMEVGLRVLGTSLNDANLDARMNPSWERILRRCDEQLKLPLDKRSQEWKAEDQFYSDATANLRAVKNAWRNPTMHVERDYEEDEALEVLSAVKGFMKHLAGRLSEQGPDA